MRKYVIFARQGMLDRGMPFVITADRKSAYGMLAQYAKPELMNKENEAFGKTMVSKHKKAD